jgi:hypothetical protein
MMTDGIRAGITLCTPFVRLGRCAAPGEWIIDADGDFFFGCIQFCFTATRAR